MQKLIEEKNDSSEFVFISKIESIGFAESIGRMDKNTLFDQEKRDKELAKIGKKLFKKHPLKKKKLIKIRIEKDIKILSQQEIDELLTGEKGIRFKKLYRWLLVIYFKDKRYKIGLPYKKIEYENKGKIDYSYSKNVLSQEEIGILLEEIKFEKTSKYDRYKKQQKAKDLEPGKECQI